MLENFCGLRGPRDWSRHGQKYVYEVYHALTEKAGSS